MLDTEAKEATGFRIATEDNNNKIPKAKPEVFISVWSILKTVDYIAGLKCLTRLDSNNGVA